MVSGRSPGARIPGGQRGMALVLALVLIALGLAVGAAIAGNLLQASTLLRRQVEAVNLEALLDAGMARALAELDIDPAWRGGEVRLDAGSASISVADFGGFDRQVDLEATFRGRVWRASAVVSADPSQAPVVNGWQPTAAGPLTRPPERAP